MLDVSLIFKLGGAGVILTILEKVLKTGGKDDIASIVNIAGIAILLLVSAGTISKLFESAKAMFGF